MSESSATASDPWKWPKRLGRLGLFLLGVGAIVYVVRDAGPDQVLATLLGAGLFVPFIVLLEAAFMSMDVFSLRALMGAPARAVPVSVWIRSGLVAYAVMILFPGGRAAGEVVRATQLAPHLGGAKALGYGARLQAATMLGNTAISVPAALACFWEGGVGAVLPWLVLGNGIVTAAIGGAILFVSRRSQIGGWLGRRFAALSTHGERFDEALREETPFLPAFLFSTLGRVFQTVQYGLILVAVGGTLGVSSALVAQGIHLVGAGAGDLVPNQAGITEGAYWMFSEALGFASDPAKAVGIALVARFCQYLLAAVGLVTWGLVRADAPSTVPAS